MSMLKRIKKSHFVESGMLETVAGYVSVAVGLAILPFAAPIVMQTIHHVTDAGNSSSHSTSVESGW